MTGPRKFRLTDIVTDGHTNYVIVDHRVRGTKAEYRVVPVTGRRQRFGRAAWRMSNELHPTGERSAKGSLVTYRANEWLKAELDGRGCECHCCVHTAIPRGAFNQFTGEMKDDAG